MSAALKPAMLDPSASEVFVGRQGLVEVVRRGGDEGFCPATLFGRCR
jgi:hypothetical protein